MPFALAFFGLGHWELIIIALIGLMMAGVVGAIIFIAVKSSSTSALSNPQLPACPMCGGSISPNAASCPKCGEPLQPQKPSGPQP